MTLSSSLSLRETRRAVAAVEVLIVMGMVTVLTLLAYGNWERSQTRSRLGKVLGDLNTQRRAVEAYRADFDSLPRHTRGVFAERPSLDPGGRCPNTVWGDDIWNGTAVFGTLPREMTTPVAYLSTFAEDPFHVAEQGRATAGLYGYESAASFEFEYNCIGNVPVPEEPGFCVPGWERVRLLEFTQAMGGYALSSQGPMGAPVGCGGFAEFVSYDPTNGTRSAGRIMVTERDPSAGTFVRFR